MNKLRRYGESPFTRWKRTDWEHTGYQTMMSCREQADAIETCALHLQSYEDELQPELSALDSAIKIRRHRSIALHDSLYDLSLIHI